ncbi:hypothetical protein FS749_005217 [Ceratobasidium sp. UAMH 11750]|nr:hypothetical protein FS749_005217 [Ceratobasidium sp. UAMH 11750]
MQPPSLLPDLRRMVTLALILDVALYLLRRSRSSGLLAVSRLPLPLGLPPAIATSSSAPMLNIARLAADECATWASERRRVGQVNKTLTYRRGHVAAAEGENDGKSEMTGGHRPGERIKHVKKGKQMCRQGRDER